MKQKLGKETAQSHKSFVSASHAPALKMVQLPIFNIKRITGLTNNRLLQVKRLIPQHRVIDKSGYH